MADISAEIAAFKNAVYGEDVRTAMVNLANKVNNESSAAAATADGSVTTLCLKVGIDDTVISALNNGSLIVKSATEQSYTTINNYIINGGTGKKQSITGSIFNISSDISVTPKKLYRILGSANWENYAYAFYDVNNNFLSGKRVPNNTATVQTVEDIVIAPDTSSYLVISLSTNGYCYSLDTFSQTKRGVIPFELFPINSNGTNVAYTEITSQLILPDGKIKHANATNFRTTDYIDVSSISALQITASCGFGNGVFAFYDAAKIPIYVKITENTSSYAFEKFDFVAVPTDAKYLVVAYSTTIGVPTIKKITSASIGNAYKWLGKKWACIGDSLTEENSKTTKHYFDYISEKTGITVVNLGVSGSGYARLADESKAFYQRTNDIPTNADVITIFGSFNDLGSGLSIGAAIDSGTTTIAGCINTTIDNIQARIPLANIGIVAPTPWGNWPPATSGYAYNYVQMLKDICYLRSIPFLNLWVCSNLRPWDVDFLPYAYSRDEGGSTHPNENGHKLIAPHFEVFLDSLLIS